MRWRKKYWSRLLLCIEIYIFFSLYWFGTDGLCMLHALQQENRQLTTEVEREQKELLKIETEVERYRIDPFYREKQAREQLQMARRSEEIFFVTKKGAK